MPADLRELKFATHYVNKGESTDSCKILLQKSKPRTSAPDQSINQSMINMLIDISINPYLEPSQYDQTSHLVLRLYDPLVTFHNLRFHSPKPGKGRSDGIGKWKECNTIVGLIIVESGFVLTFDLIMLASMSA